MQMGTRMGMQMGMRMDMQMGIGALKGHGFSRAARAIKSSGL
jgi:hypothetical protein